jgi:CubicO group peptidase (beta-lactamase class C family)
MSALIEQKQELQFVPGDSSEYSNLGYMILAEIVKQVSETDFKDYLHSNIFKPSGMVRTNIYNADEIKQIENVAKGYALYPFTGKYEEAIKIPEFVSNYVLSGFQGDGNVYSTTIDLFNFYKALSNNILISEESLKTVFQKHIPARLEGTPDYGNSYGYGWTIINAPLKIVQRGGELTGYVSNTIWNISEERLIVYLSNDYLSYTSYQNQIPYSIGGIFYQNNVQIPKMIASVELTKIVVTSSVELLSDKIKEIKINPDLYQIDFQGLMFLVMKLEQIGNKEKADFIKNSFKQ